MSISVLRLVETKTVASALHKAILSYFAWKAADDGSNIRVSKSTIAEVTHYGKRTVFAAIRQLVTQGLISITGSWPCAQGFIVVYRLNLYAIKALKTLDCFLKGCSPSIPAAEPEVELEATAPDSVDNLSVAAPETAKGCSDSTPGVLPHHPTDAVAAPNRPLINHKKTLAAVRELAAPVVVSSEVSATERQAHQEICRTIRVAAGVVPVVSSSSLWSDRMMRSFVDHWRNNLSLSVETIVNVITKVRLRDPGKAFSSPNFFTKPMENAVARSQKPQPRRQRMELWLKMGDRPEKAAYRCGCSTPAKTS